VRSYSILLTVVLAVALLARLLVYAQLADGPALHMHVWTQSDMHFFDDWAGRIVDGDLLSAGDVRPYHRRHRKLACAARESSGAPLGPCDDAAIVATWDAWVGHATLWQDPLYPYGLAALYASVGRHPLVPYAANVLLGLGSVALAFVVAAMLGGPAAALLGGLLAALLGPLLFYETLALREVAITFFGLAGVVSTIAALRSGAPRARAGLMALSGVLAGMSVLLKSSALIFAAATAVLIVWWCRAEASRAARLLAVFLVAMVLSMSPLIVRNVVVGVPAFSIASTGPLNFLNGNAADRSTGGGSSISLHAPAIMASTGGQGAAVVRATLATHDGIGSWIALLVTKLVSFWHWPESPNNASYYYFKRQVGALSGLFVGFALIAPLAIVGLAPALRRTRLTTVLVAYIASGMAVCVVFYNLSRFRLPLAVAMTALAGCGLVSIGQAVGRRDVRGALGRLAVVVLAALLVLAPWQPYAGHVRIADHGVANEIATHLARRSLAAGDMEQAATVIDRQLAIEPAELRAIEPGPQPTRVSVEMSAIAGGFAPLHDLMADVETRRGDLHEAAEHSRRAAVLRRINAPYAASAAQE